VTFTSDTSDTTETAIVDAASRLFTAITNGDIAAVDALWSDDIAVWRTESRRGPARTDDKARALRVVDWFITVTTERHYEVLDRRLFAGGSDGSIGGFVQQHVLRATGHGGQSICMRVCIVIKVDAGGRIDRIDEYFDPAEIAPLVQT
jgi:ketosteroid isomerase-like protein